MVSIRRGLLLSLLFATALVVLFQGTAIAQLVFGSIIGTVTDPSGSAVANAKVTITDVNKGTSFEVTTNDSGQYTKGQLIPDPYTVTIEASGFAKVVSNTLTVQADQATQYNATMQVGNVQQQVEVTAAAPLLQTDRADVAQTFTAQQINELPSIGRNLQSFALLNPGTQKLGWQHASDENPQGSIQMVVNGQLFDSTGYYLDGTINQDPILGIIVINPTFDSVSEVKQANQGYDAEYGYSGAGLFIYSTKSGTNQFHGDAFEFLYVNTPGFQDFGRNPFTEPTGAPTTRQNQFGGSIGGRIIKDKLFFFGDAQLERQSKGGSVNTTVPTAQERTGNLSDWLAASPGYPGCLSSTAGCLYQIYDPSTGNQTTGVGRSPFPNNVIPTSRLSPQALAIMNYWPMPNAALSGNVPYNNYTTSGALTFDANQWDTRWDYYLNEKNTFFGRYSYAQFTEQAPGAFGNLAGGPDFSNANYSGSSNTLNQSLAAGWTHTSSATLINEFRFGYMRYHVNDVPNDVTATPATDAGIPGLNTSSITGGMPAFYINNPAGNAGQLGYALGVNQCNCPLDQLERQYQFVDNVSNIRGNHNIKFGADIRYAENLRVPSDSHRAGELTFNNATTGYIASIGANPVGGVALASFLLGDVGTFNRYVSSSTNAQERQKRPAFYAQDEWHITPKLTFTYGFRWEMIFPETVNGPGNGAELNVNTGLMDVFGIGLTSNHGYQSMNWHNIAPRTSIAYQVTPKMVVRAGYGWTYSLGVFGNNFGHNVTQNPPVLANQNLTQQNVCGNSFCSIFNLAQGPPAFNPANYQGASYVPNANGVYKWPAGTTLGAFTRPGELTLPTFYLYNFTVQYQVTNKMAVSGGYVGNSARHTLLGTDENWNENQQYFIPGVTAGAYPFDGLLGPRYNYGWTGGVNYFCNCANAQYNSFQALIKVNAAAGYTLQGNYTYQVSKGDGWGGNEAYTFLYDRPLGYGNSPNLPHQQWTLANNYELPFGRGRKWGSNVNRWVDAVAGGWNVNFIYTFYSGLPFMPAISDYGGAAQPYTGPNNRPNVGSGSPYPSNQNRNSWVLTCPNGACTSGPFLFPAANTFGNYPINTLIGPWFNNIDASIQKQFALTERFKLTFRVDSTNLFNHTNLGLPSNSNSPNIETSTGGQITTTAQGNLYNMRRIQYSASINF